MRCLAIVLLSLSACTPTSARPPQPAGARATPADEPGPTGAAPATVAAPPQNEGICAPVLRRLAPEPMPKPVPLTAPLKELYDRGLALLQAKRLAESEAVTLQCLTSEPGACLCRRTLAILRARQNSKAEAVEAYRDYVCMCPDMPDHDDALGVVRQLEKEGVGAPHAAP